MLCFAFLLVLQAVCQVHREECLACDSLNHPLGSAFSLPLDQRYTVLGRVAAAAVCAACVLLYANACVLYQQQPAVLVLMGAP